MSTSVVPLSQFVMSMPTVTTHSGRIYVPVNLDLLEMEKPALVRNINTVHIKLEHNVLPEIWNPGIPFPVEKVTGQNSVSIT